MSSLLDSKREISTVLQASTQYLRSKMESYPWPAPAPAPPKQTPESNVWICLCIGVWGSVCVREEQDEEGDTRFGRPLLMPVGRGTGDGGLLEVRLWFAAISNQGCQYEYTRRCQWRRFHYGHDTCALRRANVVMATPRRRGAERGPLPGTTTRSPAPRPGVDPHPNCFRLMIGAQCCQIWEFLGRDRSARRRQRPACEEAAKTSLRQGTLGTTDTARGYHPRSVRVCADRLGSEWPSPGILLDGLTQHAIDLIQDRSLSRL